MKHLTDSRFPLTRTTCGVERKSSPRAGRRDKSGSAVEPAVQMPSPVKVPCVPPVSTTPISVVARSCVPAAPLRIDVSVPLLGNTSPYLSAYQLAVWGTENYTTPAPAPGTKCPPSTPDEPCGVYPLGLKRTRGVCVRPGVRARSARRRCRQTHRRKRSHRRRRLQQRG